MTNKIKHVIIDTNKETSKYAVKNTNQQISKACSKSRS